MRGCSWPPGVSRNSGTVKYSCGGSNSDAIRSHFNSSLSFQVASNMTNRIYEWEEWDDLLEEAVEWWAWVDFTFHISCDGRKIWNSWAWRPVKWRRKLKSSEHWWALTAICDPWNDHLEEQRAPRESQPQAASSSIDLHS